MANDSQRHNHDEHRRRWNDQDDHNQRGYGFSTGSVSGVAGRGADSEHPSTAEVTVRLILSGISLYFFLAGLIALGLKVTG